ncbi:MAG: hypothetical protein RIR49_1901 [Actinomycetota bacterium]|jgi:hypothetical protein
MSDPPMSRAAIRRRRRIAIVGLVVVLALVLPMVLSVLSVFAADDGVGERLGPASATAVAERIAPSTGVLVIGDSSIASLRWVRGAAGALIGERFTLDLESCRRLVARSCRGREGRTPNTALEALRDHADTHTTLVMATGYNDSSTAFEPSFRAIVDEARRLGYDRIVWLTLRSAVDYVAPEDSANHRAFASNNATLRRLVASGGFPEVVIADWGRHSADRPEWFTADGVHHRPLGAWAIADYLSRVLAHLDGRSCPAPELPSSAPADPCPDPDAGPPVAAISSLYPVVPDALLCYEVGVGRTVVCARDNHVIAMYRALSHGDSGADVEALQARLIRLGFLTGEVTGQFRDGTRDAVAIFQTASGLEPTGMADVATLVALGFEVAPS